MRELAGEFLDCWALRADPRAGAVPPLDEADIPESHRGHLRRNTGI